MSRQRELDDRTKERVREREREREREKKLPSEIDQGRERKRREEREKTLTDFPTGKYVRAAVLVCNQSRPKQQLNPAPSICTERQAEAKQNFAQFNASVNAKWQKAQAKLH